MQHLMDYYNNELQYLRKLGESFSKQYPGVANRLGNGVVTEDPHVERLIQSAAFLTARVRQELDDQFPQVVGSMLELIAPNSLTSNPSIAIAQVDSGAATQSKMVMVPRASRLSTRTFQDAETQQSPECQFQTCYPVEVWPIRLVEADLAGAPFRVADVAPGTKSVLTLRFAWTTKKQLPVPGMSRIRCYLSGEMGQVESLYELLFAHAIEANLSPQPTRGDKNADRKTGMHEQLANRFLRIAPVGFESADTLRPHCSRVPLGHELLSDFFTFPRKFMFFDIEGLGEMSGPEFSVSVSLSDRRPELEVSVNAQSFQLNCTPVINLFSQRAQPIRLSHEKHEFPIIPDEMGRRDTEVFSIDKVSTIAGDGHVQEFAKLYSLQHSATSEGHPLYWTSRREQRWDDKRKEVKDAFYLSLVNSSFEEELVNLPDSAVLVDTTCTNGMLPAKLPFGGTMETDLSSNGSTAADERLWFHCEKGVFKRFRCLTRPTPIRRVDMDHSHLWKLVSNLSLNHLSIISPENEPKRFRAKNDPINSVKGSDETTNDRVAAIRDVLSVYDLGVSFGKPFPFEAIVDLSSHRCARRVSEQQLPLRIHAGFYRGVSIRLTVQRERFAGHCLYLFASVLDRFFALYSSLNSFTQLTVQFEHEYEGREWSWPARSGERLV
ncbi:MAG: type VI secretion system baseplate subunit TssF [Pirellulaceae bacterium]|nr:type VI secretion system baseplate subunit TssF [Pirellulaceae bacterium]